MSGRPRVLNVAEKNSVAKAIASVLSGGNARIVSGGASPRNPIWAFEFDMPGRGIVDMHVTSVAGHLKELEFASSHKSWDSCNPIDLFDAPVVWQVPEASKNLERQLQDEARRAKLLVLWLDCDREGEGIAFEVSDTCGAVNAHLEVKRARFSSIAERDLMHAIGALAAPDKNQADAVRARSELDLRLGAAFTRLQTKALQNRFIELAGKVLSWGPCQFPTLGFVVKRYVAIDKFVPEKFWTITLAYPTPGGVEAANVEGSDADDTEGELYEAGRADDSSSLDLATAASNREAAVRGRRGYTGGVAAQGCNSTAIPFTWTRGRLFDYLCARVFFEDVEVAREAVVTSVSGRDASRAKPVGLNSVDFAKLASTKLGMTSADAAKIAEDLYSDGIISYPRTETQDFDDAIDLRALIDAQAGHSIWGAYARNLLDGSKYGAPRVGGKHDGAHPPIHPLRAVEHGALSNDAWRVYELIVRHFLAVCSRDATGKTTSVRVELGGEAFTASGTVILDRGFLEVYPYSRWNARLLPNFVVGQKFVPTDLSLAEGSTVAPGLLVESELIDLMESHGIGTDATIPELIRKVTTGREYIERAAGNRFEPTTLGYTLVTVSIERRTHVLHC